MNHHIVRWLVILLAGVGSLAFAPLAQEESDSVFTVHVVQRGENLFRIALQYNMFAEQVAIANGITDSNSIIVGQRLIIPLAAGYGGSTTHPHRFRRRDPGQHCGRLQQKRGGSA